VSIEKDVPAEDKLVDAIDSSVNSLRQYVKKKLIETLALDKKEAQ